MRLIGGCAKERTQARDHGVPHRFARMDTSRLHRTSHADHRMSDRVNVRWVPHSTWALADPTVPIWTVSERLHAFPNAWDFSRLILFPSTAT